MRTLDARVNSMRRSIPPGLGCWRYSKASILLRERADFASGDLPGFPVCMRLWLLWSGKGHQLKNSMHNAGKKLDRNKNRLKGDRISLEALLANTARESQARMTSAELELIMRHILDVLEEAVSSKLMMPDELQAVMYTLGGTSPDSRLSASDAAIKAEAQEIARAAMKAEDKANACKLAKRAIEMDPEYVDALVLMADLNTRTLHDAIEVLQIAVAAGKRSLGEAFINAHSGYFWLQMETRPYMRSLHSLAGAFFCANRELDAIRIYERMLELNPRDNQGARYPLIGLYLEMGNLKRAAELLKKFDHDASAMFEWARVLERFLNGDLDGASRALKAARKANGHIELLLTRKHPWPAERQDMYSPGGEEEAAFCFRYLNGALKKQRRAFSWLLAQLAADGSKPAQSADILRRMQVEGTVQ